MHVNNLWFYSSSWIALLMHSGTCTCRRIERRAWPGKLQWPKELSLQLPRDSRHTKIRTKFLDRRFDLNGLEFVLFIGPFLFITSVSHWAVLLLPLWSEKQVHWHNGFKCHQIMLYFDQKTNHSYKFSRFLLSFLQICRLTHTDEFHLHFKFTQKELST